MAITRETWIGPDDWPSVCLAFETLGLPTPADANARRSPESDLGTSVVALVVQYAVNEDRLTRLQVMEIIKFAIERDPDTVEREVGAWFEEQTRD